MTTPPTRVAVEMARAKQMVIDGSGGTVRIASAEDTLLQKLRWYHLGGGTSDRQWRDVLGIMKAQQQRLDLDYVRPWAEQLGLEDLLRRALMEAGRD